jgi:hypothetical protein
MAVSQPTSESPGLTSSRLQQMSAQATSTKANHRPASRSQRTCSRRKQPEPRQRPLHLPPLRPQPRRPLHPTPSDPRGDPTPSQPGAVGGAVVALVGVDRPWSGAPPARRCADWWAVVDHRLQHGHVGDACGGDCRGKGQPLSVADQVQFGPGLAAIDRICAHVVPRVWCARWPSPRSPVTSPACPARRADQGRRGGAGRTRQPRPTRSVAATWSRLSHSRARALAAAATA